MNKCKGSSLVRLIAFFLVAIILVCTFGFASDGWTFKDKITNNMDNSIGGVTSLPENKPTEFPGDLEADNSQTVKLPEYVNYLTGLETDEALASIKPIAFVMGTDSPLYGSSLADITVEIPTENGNTRLLTIFTDVSCLWKIGSLLPTRGYISNLALFFGANIAYNNNDDSINYTQCDINKNSIYLSEEKGFSYTEFSYYSYTNTNLLSSATASSSVDLTNERNKDLPYLHNPFGNQQIKYEDCATQITINDSNSSYTELIFAKEDGKYHLSRNSVATKDLLTGNGHSYTNCFILFADSITYESTIGTQTVMNTIGSGKGFYFTEGSVTEISWTSDANGNMIFCDPLGEKLTVNRGNSYINIIKSSKVDTISFE